LDCVPHAFLFKCACAFDIGSFDSDVVAGWHSVVEAHFLEALCRDCVTRNWLIDRRNSHAKGGPELPPALLYLPLPFLLWAAIRFGPKGSSAVFLLVSLFEIWAAIGGHGPFATQSPENNALSVQLFLILASMPLLFLPALIKERERAQEAAHQKEERLELALACAQQASLALSDSQDKLRLSHSQIRKLLGKLINAQEAERRRISRELHDDLNQKIATLSMNMSQLKRKLPMPESELVAELDQL